MFAFCESGSAAPVATLDSAQGLVEVRRVGSSRFLPVKIGNEFQAKDIIHTAKGAKAGVLLSDGSILRLSENTSLEFQDKNPQERGRPLSLSEGKAYFFSREPKESPLVSTPSATTAVRGTEFALEVTKDKTIVMVLDGAVNVSNSFGAVDLMQGEQAQATPLSAPVKSIMINPLDAVQWALYFPVVLSPRDLLESFPNASQEERDLFAALERREYQIATATLAKLSKDTVIAAVARSYIDNAEGRSATALSTLVTRAPQAPIIVGLLGISVALSQGDIASAEKLITLIEKMPSATSQEQALYLAQRAIIDLVMNRNDSALEQSERAYRERSDLSAPALAYAYALQGKLRLADARAVLESYCTTHPYDSFAQARLAELQLGFGENDLAQETAERAVAQDEKNWYARTVLAYSALLRGDTERAQVQFTEAIALDSSAALPRLGYGLMKIHRGELEAGRDDIARAVALAPQVSVYRSYLGKAYFEERREQLSIHEYDRAIALDPRDPTPFLYRTFSHLSKNDPVAALHDIETSIQNNNNRAVYRSSLLLDNDLAVRSSSLAETYNTLGFTELARTEAIKSLSKDYANYSAHLLLSEGYQSIATDDAAVSERKIADLLAPPSFNLFGRQAGEASLNEYTTLYDRPESRTELGVQTSTYDQFVAPSATFAEKGDSFGYAVGYRPVYAQGSKSGNYRRSERFFVTTESQLSPETRVSGDLHATTQHARDKNSAPDDTQFETYGGSLGLYQKVGDHSKLIGDLTLAKDRHRFGSSALERLLDQASIADGVAFQEENQILIDEVAHEDVRTGRAALQLITAGEQLSTVSGLQLYRASIVRDERSVITDDELGIFTDLNYQLRSRQTPDLAAHDLYNYSTLHLARWVDLVAGGSWSHVQIEDREVTPFVTMTHSETRFNPKVGIILTPDASTTVRAAYFEGLRKSSLEDNLSIEPTLVGGINQRFTDFSGARARNLGGGVDYKLSPSIYVGGEALLRHVADALRSASSLVPVDYDEAVLSASEVAVGNLATTHREEKIYRGYLYSILSDRLVNTIDYSWHQVERTDPEIGQDIILQRARTSLRYFCEGGLYPFIAATWREQERKGSDFLTDGSSDFVIADIGVGYRLPQRQGTIQLQLNNIFDKSFSYDQSLGVESFVNSGIGGALVASVNF
jgi:ferric-dicitrate binding protein FerR (iron transport regulator)